MQMKAYSMDLRVRVVAVVEKGWTWEQAAEAFAVSLASVGRFVSAHKAGASLAARRGGGRPRLLRQGEHVEALRAHLEAEPDAPLAQRCEHLQKSEGVTLSVSSLWRAMRRLGWTRKKRPSPPASRTRSSARRGAGG